MSYNRPTSVHLAFIYNCFSATEVAQLLDFAEKAQLIVIPLVQTFGHFEVSILKVEYVISI